MPAAKVVTVHLRTFKEKKMAFSNIQAFGVTMFPIVHVVKRFAITRTTAIVDCEYSVFMVDEILEKRIV